ncbi:MAG: regulatory iron-sulfur-containing complex subunit RicT [Gemmatimonadales bacterium]
MPQTVEVRFKGTRRDFFHWPETEEPLHLSESVVVEAERGFDFGRVQSAGAVAEKKCNSCTSCGVGEGIAESRTGGVAVEEPGPDAPAPGGAPPATVPGRRLILRRASQEEVRQANDLRRAEEDARRQVIAKVRHHKLDMKVSDTEWQWDRTKLTVFFTAEKRVDFRTLVRDLANIFRARIDLRQIGVRDEAARLTGVGRCGREYCCSTWLGELSPVSLSLAKDQHLSLNPAQISGGCGRLLCCLRYEHEFYVAARKRFPREGKMLQTAQGVEKVVAVDIFRERVFLRGEEGARIIPLIDLNDEIEQSLAAVARGELPESPRVPSLPLAESSTRRPAEPASRRPPEAPSRRPAPPAPRQGARPAPPRASAAPPPPPAPPPAPPAPAKPEVTTDATEARRPRRRRRGRRGGRGGGDGSAPPPPAPAE